MTAHIESEKKDIAKKVIMPGDPLRAKYIAENFLKDYKQVNAVRGMLAYTGYYENNLITVFASGMGGPSIGIYAYELFKFYDVDTIIRVGTSGAATKDISVKDLIIVEDAYTLSSYPKLFFADERKLFKATENVNSILKKKAEKLSNRVHFGRIITSDIFDPYVEKKKYLQLYPAGNYLAYEMEAAILFCIAEHLNKKAGTILTVVDSEFTNDYLSSEEREQNLNQMIKLSLDALIELD